MELIQHIQHLKKMSREVYMNFNGIKKMGSLFMASYR
jgi:hypothetical protein